MFLAIGNKLFLKKKRRCQSIGSLSLIINPTQTHSKHD